MKISEDFSFLHCVFILSYIQCLAISSPQAFCLQCLLHVSAFAGSTSALMPACFRTEPFPAPWAVWFISIT